MKQAEALPILIIDKSNRTDSSEEFCQGRFRTHGRRWRRECRLIRWFFFSVHESFLLDERRQIDEEIREKGRHGMCALLIVITLAFVRREIESRLEKNEKIHLSLPLFHVDTHRERRNVVPRRTVSVIIIFLRGRHVCVWRYLIRLLNEDELFKTQETSENSVWSFKDVPLCK